MQTFSYTGGQYGTQGGRGSFLILSQIFTNSLNFVFNRIILILYFDDMFFLFSPNETSIPPLLKHLPFSTMAKQNKHFCLPNKTIQRDSQIKISTLILTLSYPPSEQLARLLTVVQRGYTLQLFQATNGALLSFFFHTIWFLFVFLLGENSNFQTYSIVHNNSFQTDWNYR